MLTTQDYKDALYALDGCNPSGIAHSFAEVLRKLNEEARELGQGTDWVRHHPIAILYAEKLKELCSGDFSAAYNHCKERSDESARH